MVGTVVNAVTDRGLTVAQTEKVVVSQTLNLFPSASASSEQVGPSKSRYRFSLPIPSYVQGGTEELPPSFIAYHPRYSSQVKYVIKVDMHKKGLRIHERYVLLIG